MVKALGLIEPSVARSVITIHVDRITSGRLQVAINLVQRSRCCCLALSIVIFI